MGKQIKLKILKFSIAAAIFVSPLYVSAQQGQVDYTEAYKLCSPVAHQMTKRHCNYSRVYESYYVQCMHNQGYDDDDASGHGEDFYEGYMQSYKYCSSVSKQSTERYCGYGNLYKTYYDQCMIKHGFNEYGDRVDSSGKKEYFEFNF